MTGATTGPDRPQPDAGSDEQDLSATFPIVGVGASAGGLEAFTHLLKALPADTGMAFVLVQHLAPNHPSALSEILARSTPMPVTEVQDEPTVFPNHVYVIPPARDMRIAGGKLQLVPRTARGPHHSVDQFFQALAEDQRHLAIGVVLSGTATDGTAGLEAIKAEGGITFAQDASAQHDGMPHSAIASGCVDFVLSPTEIAHELARIARHPYRVPDPEAGGGQENRADLRQILHLLLRATGVDFSHYKLNTLWRRISRRMVLQKLDGLADYRHFLQESPQEVQALYRDILISVTSFFRDPAAFEALKRQVFPHLIADRRRQEPVRMWTLGCSTGQEAYSVAIAFAEFVAERGSEVPLQLFATDINAEGIETARAGVYPKDIARDVSPERLQRFFVEVDGSYRISKAIRDSCVFSRHNVLADPPFSRIDMVSCRNLLIYLEPVLQRKVLPNLHYALRPGGFLWLGSSETIGSHRNLFEATDSSNKIYVRVPGRASPTIAPRMPPVLSPGAPLTGDNERSTDGASHLLREADRMLLSRFAPPSVLVSADLDILQYRGDTGPFLTPSTGKASLNVLKMLREGLKVAVRAALKSAAREGKPIRSEGLRVRSEGGLRRVSVEVIPVKDRSTGGFLILFEHDGEPREGIREGDPVAASPRGSDGSESRLELELAATRDYLQSVIEQHESANEEFQSANEEVQSANEELQSINEELETSKEEIQSANEELVTVNDELNDRNRELNRLGNDLVNLFGSVQIAIVLVGADLRIRRYTPVAERLLSLISTDVGRPLADIRLNLNEAPDLELLMAEVLESGQAYEQEVQNKQGHWYALQLRPYRTFDKRVDGVIVMLVDIDLMKRAHAFTESIVETLREPLLVLDSQLRVRAASASFYRTFLVQPEETVGRQLYELGDGQWEIPQLRGQLERVLSQQEPVVDYEVEHNFQHIGIRMMRLNAQRLMQVIGQEPLILLGIEDITERKRLEVELRQNALDLAEADRRKNEFLALLAHELRNPLAPIRTALEIFRLAGDDAQATTRASESIERQLGQMIRLVDDLLDISRISRGRIQLRRGRVELASAVHHAAEATLSLYENGGHQLTITLPPEPIYLDADLARLTQILSNLLNNAFKFTDSGGRIELLVDREGDEAVIRVKDSGIGMTADQMPRVFDMFTQVDTSLERSASGMGIGLTLVKSLVEKHSGSVDVHSDGLGRGSEFVVRLPIAADEPLSETASTEVAEDRASLAGTLRILVVEDNPDSALMMAMLLGLLGHQTQTAHDGPAALTAAESFRPEVILLDIGLPEINGYEVCRRIRGQDWGRDITIIALTGWGNEEDRRRSREAGFDEHLVKPVELAVVTRLLDQRGMRAN